MRIGIASVFVQDQQNALEFYTNVLGFVKKVDVPVGEFSWLTVASPEGPDGIELLLEPNGNPVAKTYQEALFEQGIPATMFFSDDLQAEYERLRDLGVSFTTPPTTAGGITFADFDDTCGNLIRLTEG